MRKSVGSARFSIVSTRVGVKHKRTVSVPPTTDIFTLVNVDVVGWKRINVRDAWFKNWSPSNP